MVSWRARCCSRVPPCCHLPIVAAARKGAWRCVAVSQRRAKGRVTPIKPGLPLRLWRRCHGHAANVRLLASRYNCIGDSRRAWHATCLSPSVMTCTMLLALGCLTIPFMSGCVIDVHDNDDDRSPGSCEYRAQSYRDPRCNGDAGADLEDSVQVGANFDGINLSCSNLNGAVMTGANLSHASLFGSDLRNATFVGANLSHADLSGADLRCANFVGANLSGADLRDTLRDGTTFVGANLDGAIFD